MVIKVYISGISASKEVKKRQQRALFILDSLKVDYEAIDITEPGNQEENDRFRETCKRVGNDKLPLPPQFFNEETYCGDWDDFFIASDEDTVLQFLKLEAAKAGEDQGPVVMKSPLPLVESAFPDEAVDGRKSVNGHVKEQDVGEEERESDAVLPNGVKGEDHEDDTEITDDDKSTALTPRPLPAEEEHDAAADDLLSPAADEESKLGNRNHDEGDGEDVDENEVEE